MSFAWANLRFGPHPSPFFFGPPFAFACFWGSVFDTVPLSLDLSLFPPSSLRSGLFGALPARFCFSCLPLRLAFLAFGRSASASGEPAHVFPPFPRCRLCRLRPSGLIRAGPPYTLLGLGGRLMRGHAVLRSFHASPCDVWSFCTVAFAVFVLPFLFRASATIWSCCIAFAALHCLFLLVGFDHTSELLSLASHSHAGPWTFGAGQRSLFAVTRSLSRTMRLRVLAPLCIPF